MITRCLELVTGYISSDIDSFVESCIYQNNGVRHDKRDELYVSQFTKTSGKMYLSSSNSSCESTDVLLSTDSSKTFSSQVAFLKYL